MKNLTTFKMLTMILLIFVPMIISINDSLAF